MLLVQSKLRIEEKDSRGTHPLLLCLCDYHEKNSIPRSQITRKRNEVKIRCYQYRRNGESVLRERNLLH